MSTAFDKDEAAAIVAALNVLDSAPGLSTPEKDRYQAALEALGKLRGFQVDKTSGTRRAVEYLDLPTQWPRVWDIRLPPWGEQAQREYLGALTKRYGNWRDTADHLRGIVERQFEKANGLFAFNSILIAVLAFHQIC